MGRAGWSGATARMEVVTLLRMTVSSSLRSWAAAAATAQIRSAFVKGSTSQNSCREKGVRRLVLITSLLCVLKILKKLVTGWRRPYRSSGWRPGFFAIWERRPGPILGVMEREGMIGPARSVEVGEENPFARRPATDAEQCR
jgi:hypothetical protein